MYWKLILNQESGRVELWNDQGCLATENWQEQRKTSKEIVTAMKELLSQEELTYKDVPRLDLELDLPPHATARRIAETLQNVYNTFVVR
jgi:hypothetical protein